MSVWSLNIVFTVVRRRTDDQRVRAFISSVDIRTNCSDVRETPMDHAFQLSSYMLQSYLHKYVCNAMLIDYILSNILSMVGW